jgi:hypothetical protein
VSAERPTCVYGDCQRPVEVALGFGRQDGELLWLAYCAQCAKLVREVFVVEAELRVDADCARRAPLAA